MRQGAKANRSGAVAEMILTNHLSAMGYKVDRQYRVCVGIYGRPIFTDLYLSNVTGFSHGLAIESKWQDIGGSVDEKFPYLVANIREKFPCPAIVVVDGGGAKPGAIDWLKNQVDGEHLLGVFDLAGFVSWSLRAMPAPIIAEVLV